jgi:hypothetical protein
MFEHRVPIKVAIRDINLKQISRERTQSQMVTHESLNHELLDPRMPDGGLGFAQVRFQFVEKRLADSKRLPSPRTLAARVRSGSSRVRFCKLLVILKHFSGSFLILGLYRGGPQIQRPTTMASCRFLEPRPASATEANLSP